MAKPKKDVRKQSRGHRLAGLGLAFTLIILFASIPLGSSLVQADRPGAPGRSGAATAELAGRAMVRDFPDPPPSSDRLVVALTGARPPIADRVFQCYLANEAFGRDCGELPVADGAINRTIDFPGVNLIFEYETFRIMQEKRLVDGQLPVDPLVHIRYVASRAWDETPGDVGYGVGLAREAEHLLTHANFAKASADGGNLAHARMHAEHVLNILVGEGDPLYGDHDNSGTIDNPGDGFGLLKYAQNVENSMEQLATAPDATANMVERANQVRASVANIWKPVNAGTWSDLVIARAQEVLGAGTAAEAQTPANQLAVVADRVRNGVDLNDSGQVEPIEGEGGAVTALIYARRAADYLPPDGSGVTGSIQHRSNSPDLLANQLVIQLSGLPAPQGVEGIWGYLGVEHSFVSQPGGRLLLGPLPFAGGAVNTTLTFPEDHDLIDWFDSFYLTLGAVYAEDTLPYEPLSLIHDAVGWRDETPGNVGYGVGLAREAEHLLTHANFAKASADGGNLADARMHAEHVLNILVGEGDPLYGDHDNNGFIENPGDGFGLLRYAGRVDETMGLLAAHGEATANMVERANQVRASVANIWKPVNAGTWSDLAIARAQEVLGAGTAAEAQTPANQLAVVADRVRNGVDLNDSGQVEPIEGEGGATTAFVYIQHAADYFPQEQDAPAETSTPTATSTSTPTPTGTVTPATPTPTGTVTPATPTPTGTVQPTGGDAHEDDDECSRASGVGVDGVPQSHTFHDVGDVDWVAFDARANKTYVIEVNNIGSKADAVVFLHDSCAAPPSSSQNNAFGSTVRLEWDATRNQRYFIKIQQFDPDFFGQDTDYTVSVTEDNQPPSAPKDPRCIAVDGSTQGVQWVRSPERDVIGYRVRFTRGGDARLKTVDGGDTTYTELTELAGGATYAMEVFAVDFSGNLSAPTAPVLECTVTEPEDTVRPSLSIQQPTAASAYTTTASMVTISGAAQDDVELSRVRARNVTKDVEGFDYSLSGKSHTFRVKDLALGVGDNVIQVTAFDAANNPGQRTITIHRLADSPGAAIIVAGHNETFGLQTNIYNSTNRAYRIFRSAGFGPDEIQYIAPVALDADGDGTADTDATATPANVEQAITTWAMDKVGPDKPLFIYLMDHGFEEKFCVNGCGAGNVVTPEDLDGWLRTLETATGVGEVTVVIEACLSGSFIDKKQVQDSLSRPNRVIISSTSHDKNAYASAQGAYFSDAFFSCIADSNDLKTCFDQARAAVQTTGTNQEPWLDDNGDGVFNPQADGSVAKQRHVTRFFSSARPRLTATSVQQQGANGTLQATVQEGAEPVELVWAAVYPPSYQEPGEVTLNAQVPVVQLDPVAGQPGRFEISYPNGFVEGTIDEYRIVFYAQDRLGITAQPKLYGEAEGLYLPLISR